MIAYRAGRAVFSMASLLALAGCGDGGLNEVKQWMDETRQQAKVTVEKLSEPKKFTPFSYSAKDSPDPYDPNKLAVALAKVKANSTSAIKPDLDRRREPLESYPLDTIKMVGTLQKPGLTYAILQIDKAIFHVKVGNYIGQNLGMITNITEDKLDLKEVVQDASGDWVERKATLELQETKK
ncbi:MAG TPA: pilus assembly protein PilP [Paucimonas sp.]|nr:pilus assembly protein PilP [Paucimonas sp.]